MLEELVKTEAESQAVHPTTLVIGRIPYINSDPFYYGLDESISQRVAAPRQLADMARKGEIDAAPLPLVDVLALREQFEPLGQWGVAVRREAGSVFLFSKVPLSSLSGMRIGVTEESSTSAALLRVLMEHRYLIKAKLVTGFSDEDSARLLIGDQAMAAQTQLINQFQYLHDLGEMWFLWQNLPFVFARWVVRKSIPTASKRFLEDEIRKAVCLFEREGSYIRNPERLKQIGKNSNEVSAYFKGFVYRLGKLEARSMELFEDLLHHPVPLPLGRGCPRSPERSVGEDG